MDKKAKLVLFSGMGCGALVWALSIPITGFREPFDSPSLYYMISMLLAGIIATLPSPKYWWLAVIGIYLGERFYALIFLPETRGFFLLGLILNLLFLTWVPSMVGALITKFLLRQREN